MPENTPRENDFLKQNQAAQFVKKSNEQLSKKIGGIFNNTAKAFSEHSDIQLENSKTLKRIDNSLNTINKALLQQNNTLSKTNAEALRLQTKTTQFLKDSKTQTNTKRKTAKDLVSKKDPDAGMRTNIGDIENLLTDIRDSDENERKKKKSIFGMLGGIGGILAAGGLVGYLMTGKKEFLISTVKGLTKYFGKGLVGLFKLGNLGKKFKTLFSGVSKIGKGFSKIGKGVGKIGKGFSNIGKGVGKFIKSIAGFKVGDIPKTIEKLKGMPKMFEKLKGMPKMFEKLKGVPKSFKIVGETVKSVGKVFSKGGLKGLTKSGLKGLTKGGAKASKTLLKKIPVVGGLMGLMFGIMRVKKGDWAGGLMEVASGIASIVPGVGTALSVAIDGLLLFRDFKGVKTGEGSMNSKLTSGAKNVGNKIVGAGKGVFGKVTGLLSKVTGFGKSAEGGGGGFDVGEKVEAVTNTGKRAFGMVKDFAGRLVEPITKDNSFSPIKLAKSSLHKLLKQTKRVGIKLFSPWNPDFEGLQPSMKRNFSNMAKEYYLKTGKEIQVNSAKRNKAGRSVHNHGFAIDIQSDDANALEHMGLLKDYGFHRPLLHWKKTKEPWHVEPFPGEDIYGPRDTINNDFRVGTLINKSSKSVKPEQGGGGMEDWNFPQGTVDRKFESDKAIQVILSNDDIDKLAYAFGEQIKLNKQPVMPSSTSHQMVSGRKF